MEPTIKDSASWLRFLTPYVTLSSSIAPYSDPSSLLPLATYRQDKTQRDP